jgi:hypothetical protein
MSSMKHRNAVTSAFGQHGRPGARRMSRPWRPSLAAWIALPLALSLTLAGCGTRQFEAQTSIPAPLVTRIPAVVGVHVPVEFSEAVHKEKREGTDYEIMIGKAQSAAFQRLMGAMFTRVVPVASIEPGAVTDPEVRGVLEPVLEDFAFITPSDAGTGLYAVSLKYRINAYSPAGQLVESWTFTGYGVQASSAMPTTGTESLRQATALAMRDAGAKLAAEFREQAIARGLLDETAPETPAEVQPPEP